MPAANFSEIYGKLVNLVYEDNLDSQRYYLSVVEEARKIPVDYLISRGCLFIPNNEYIHHYLGAEADSYGLGLYVEDRCLWTLYVLFPVQDLAGDTVGLVGWDALHKYQEIEEGAVGLSMYKGSSKQVFPKEKYFLSDIELLKRTFDKRTVFVTDGVYDSVALNYRGIPAIALLGSTFSKEVIYFLRWYKRVYVCADNDEAGLKLYQRLSKVVPGIHRVIQGKTKDIEEFLRDDSLNGPITTQLRDCLNGTITGDLWLDDRRSFRRT